MTLRFNARGCSEPLAETADTEVMVKVRRAASAGRGCR
jgi:hypothetical protein